MKSWYTIRARAPGAQGSRTDVLIYDEIGAYGITAKGFLAELGALPEGTPIDLRLNSPGGSVFDAVAIYNAIKRHEGTVTVWIDGIAASAASYVAMAGDEIVMPDNAFLMIHDPAGIVMGAAADMRAMAEALDKVGDSLAAGYAAKSGRPTDEIAALMAAETWLDATEALALGFADRLADPVRIAANFDVGRFRNAPAALAEIDATAETNDGVVAPDQEAETGAAIEGRVDAQGSADGPDPTSDDGVAPLEASPTPGDPPPDPAQIRASVLAHARAVVDLCRLAGQPEMAGRFLESDAGLDEVRTALLDAKAEAEPEIAGHHAQPGRPSSTRPWAEIVARTFKLKG